MFEIFVFIDLFFNSFLFNDNIVFINEFNQNQFDKIYEIFFQLPLFILNNEINEDDKIEIFIIKYIDLLLNFIYSFNQKIIEFKKNKLFMKNKLIFNKSSIIKIFQIIFDKIKNPILKNKIITRIIFYNYTNDKVTNNSGENNQKIIQSSFFILIILQALYNLNDFINIASIYNEILTCSNSSNINIKIILNSDIICFTFKLLINCHGNKDFDNEPNLNNFCDKAISLLKILVNFLNQSTLIKYLYNIFNIFYENIIDFDNKNNSDKYKKLILILITILSDCVKLTSNEQKQNFQYLSLSKKAFSNPYIYNIFYITNLEIEDPIIHFNLMMRINSFENIDKFNIVNFINEKTNQSLFITLDNQNQLLICEKNIKNSNNPINILASYKNIDNYLLIDNKFHILSIIIDSENKIIDILIDSNKINTNQKIINYKNFEFESFGLYIGYDFDDIYKFNKNCPNDNASIIDISNILLFNFKKDDSNFFVDEKEEDLNNSFDSDNDSYNLNIPKADKYENILAEVCFNLTNIKILKTKHLEKANFIIDKYLTKNDEMINKYLSFIDIINHFKNKYNSKLYMLSINENIEEYFSLNYIL